MHKNLVIVIDGPAGAGKSTVAKALAKALDVAYLDTGAMYRAFTFKALSNLIDLSDESTLATLAQNTQVSLQKNNQGELKVLLDGQDVSEEIRTPDVTKHSSKVASLAPVRSILVQWQRDFGQNNSLVGEGRDLGTVVFPDATHKFYLDASEESRLQRRLKDFSEKGIKVDENQLRQDMQERDERDTNRATSPLRQSEDAIYVDNSDWSVDETVVELLKHIQS